MKKYSVKAFIVLDVEAKNEDTAIELASGQVRELKPDDFEYEASEISKGDEES